MKKKKNPEEELLDDLLEMFAIQPYNFWADERRDLRDELKAIIAAKREETQKKEIEFQLEFLFNLILKCPPLLDRYEGFEWVWEEYKNALHKRLFDNKYNQDFFNALGKVKGKLNPGRPKDKQSFYKIANYVSLQLQQGKTKSEAIEKAQDMLKEDQYFSYSKSLLQKEGLEEIEAREIAGNILKYIIQLDEDSLASLLNEKLQNINKARTIARAIIGYDIKGIDKRTIERAWDKANKVWKTGRGSALRVFRGKLKNGAPIKNLELEEEG